MPGGLSKPPPSACRPSSPREKARYMRLIAPTGEENDEARETRCLEVDAVLM
jgi:hypothetical protein